MHTCRAEHVAHMPMTCCCKPSSSPPVAALSDATSAAMTAHLETSVFILSAAFASTAFSCAGCCSATGTTALPRLGAFRAAAAACRVPQACLTSCSVSAAILLQKCRMYCLQRLVRCAGGGPGSQTHLWSSPDQLRRFLLQLAWNACSSFWHCVLSPFARSRQRFKASTSQGDGVTLCITLKQ